MNITINPRPSEWAELCRRNSTADDDARIEAAVAKTIADVRSRGDEALKEYTRLYDGYEGATEMPRQEIERLAGEVPEKLRKAIDSAAANIRAFHSAQLLQPVEVVVAPGIKCVQRQVPIGKVGLYIPGGRAPLFSTVLMLAVPAVLAGCGEIVMCTPPDSRGNINPAIAYAALSCGVQRVFRIGGAQAIAAMACGTATVPAVDKIFGPGNRYVTKAKQLVSAYTSIDMPAGPSEVMVLADETAEAAFVAADLLSQAEHGPDSQAMLVCNSTEILEKVQEELARQRRALTRTDCVDRSLEGSRAVVLPYRSSMIEFANTYAPEHLILSVAEPWDAASHITAAGSVFIGNYSPESAGDYASGTNHTLPTSGWARSCSGVNIDSFTKKITYQEITRRGLATLAPVITAMAEAEGLDGHAAAVKVRTQP